jgi:hypothetical protein
MTQKPSGTFLAGAALVWRRQSLLWWVFFVNLVLAGLAAHGFQQQVGVLLDHSHAAEKFVHGFDFGWMGLLSQQPGEAFQSPGFGLFSLVFVVFFLFVTPGILEIYRRDEKLPRNLFFEACGAFFWRFVRASISFAITLIPIFIFAGLLYNWGSGMQDRDISDLPGRLMQLVAILGAIFLMMIVRLWYDVAEIHIVDANEPKIRRAIRKAWRVLQGNFLSLVRLYFSVAIVGWIVFFGGIWLWVFFVRPESIGLSLIFGQLLILSWIGTRLWQRASGTLWYRRYFALERSRAPRPEPPIIEAVAVAITPEEASPSA